jgi:hypothetical protein
LSYACNFQRDCAVQNVIGSSRREEALIYPQNEPRHLGCYESISPREWREVFSVFLNCAFTI